MIYSSSFRALSSTAGSIRHLAHPRNVFFSKTFGCSPSTSSNYLYNSSVESINTGLTNIANIANVANIANIANNARLEKCASTYHAHRVRRPRVAFLLLNQYSPILTMRAWPVARSIFDAPYVREANERTTSWISPIRAPRGLTGDAARVSN